jgi:hypothetical protein
MSQLTSWRFYVELVRKQTYITPEQDRALKRMAREDGATESEILRQALDSWLSRRPSVGRDDPFESLIGFVDGPSKVDHDDIYD